MTHLDEHKLLPDRQNALSKRHSCETQLTMVIHDWAKIWTLNGKVDTCTLKTNISGVNVILFSFFIYKKLYTCALTV